MPIITTLAGAAMVSTAYVGFRKMPDAILRRTLNRIIVECAIGKEKADGTMNNARIVKLVKKKYGYRLTIELPLGYAASKFEQFKEVIEQATRSEIRIKRSNGRLIYLDMGKVELTEEMTYSDRVWRDKVIKEKAPIVPLFTPFGVHELNFWDDASCHLLVGGTTRMGKTGLIRLLVTVIMDLLDGQAQFLMINNKGEDLPPYYNVPQIRLAESIGEAYAELKRVVGVELRARRQLLKSAACATMKDYREAYPENPVPPLFIVVDEYGRFADEQDIQDLIIEIAETAGSCDIHLIIASQRPDAVTVLKPRIKANLLARIAFTTGDEGNSNLIIGLPHAAHLGGIRGRACLVDGLPSTVQVPFLSPAKANKMLNRFRTGSTTSKSAPPPAQLNHHAPQTQATSPSFLTPDDVVDMSSREGGESRRAERARPIDFTDAPTLPRFDPDAYSDDDLS